MKNKKTFYSPRVLRRERQKRRKKAFLFLLFSVVFFSGFIYLLSTDILRVSSVRVSGADEPERIAKIENLVKDKFRGFYLGVIPKSYVFFLPALDISKEILLKDPSILRVDLSIKNLSSVLVSVIDRVPVAILCQVDSCFYFDENGIVFAPAGRGDKNLFYRFYDDAETEPVSFGASAFSKKEIEDVFSFLSRLDDWGIVAEEIHFKDDSSLEILLRGGARIFLFNGAGLADAAKRLNLLLEEDGLLERSENGDIDVDYIDLRYGNKIYFKKRYN